MVKQMFAGIDLRLSFDSYDCRQHQYPTDIDEYDFFITTGSKASVYDDLDWIPPLVRFVRLLDKRNKKLIGICFGHQLIALSRKGKVAKSDKGWGIGVAGNRVVAQPEWMTDKSSEMNILVSHQDQITELSDDTLVIAESDFCPFFIVQWGDNFLSIQGHPEWNADYSRTLINDRRDIIPADCVEIGLNSLATAPDNAKFAQWVLAFVQYKQ